MHGRSPVKPALLVLLLATPTACGPEKPIADPLGTLASPSSSARQIERAMEMLDQTPTDEQYITRLRRMLHEPGYTVKEREMALDRLVRYDRDAMVRTLELQLPRMGALQWRTRLCEIIAEEDWEDLTPTLVRAWAVPMPGWVARDRDRPERKALERMYGKDQLPDLLFELFLESNGVAQQGLRARCWEMLLRLGERDRLEALLASASIPPDDGTLLDLQAAAVELGVMPETREEILWVRKLRQPERAAFWSEAVTVIDALPPEQRSSLELRDVSILVAAARHRPELLQADRDELYARVERYLESDESGRTHGVDFSGWEGTFPQRLRQWRRDLTWADLVALNLAVDALRVEPVRDHLFNYADRDLKDTTTEYGGVLRLDDRGRYEVVEFQPRVKGNDERYVAPQAMLDAAYTSLFQFHFHATSYENARYAGPAQGDMQYAETVRANALTFTFIDRNRMNVDFYRHGGVSVDLGEIRRP